MARAALLRLLRSQSKQLTSSNCQSGHRLCRFSTNLNSASHLAATSQRRWASNVAPSGNNSKITIGPQSSAKDSHGDEDESNIVYYGPISSTIKKVKLLSLTTCCLSVSLGPVFTFLASPQMDVILKGAVSSFVIFCSASTTGVLHWFVSPYVHKLRWQPGSDSFEVEMITWLATFERRTIRFADIRPPETKRPYTTFQANGKIYFVDEEHFPNKALLARLTHSQKPMPGSAFKNL